MGFIERPQSVWWRQWFFQIHLWTGVVLAIYVIAISVSGSAIVFADRIADDAPTAPATAVATKPLSLAGLADVSRALWPGSSVMEIEADPSGDGPIRFELSDPRRELHFASIARSGSVVANVSGREPRRAVMNVLTNLHTNLLGGRSGALVNGIFGGGLALLALSGIVLWWPGRTTWKRALVIKPSGGRKRLFFDLHSAIGFWSFALVAMFALTGVALVFYTPWTNMVARFFAVTTQPVATSSWKPGKAMQSPDVFVREATSLEPTLRWDLVEIPATAGGQIIVRLRQAGVPLRVSRHAFVYIDPATGRILQDWRSDNRTFGDLITWYVVEGLHYGDYATAMQYVWVVVGLAPCVLVLTSVALWWNRLMRWRLNLIKRRATSGAGS